MMRRVIAALVAGAMLVVLAGCTIGERAASPSSAQAPSGSATRHPASGGSAVLQPSSGGILALESGAEVSVPPEALSEAALVSLRTAGSTPNVPAPRSALGPAYEFSLDGADLGGVVLLRIPLPEGISPEEYDIGAYRWNGRAWERVSGRLSGDSIQVATRSPGTFALQGTWKLASAALGLALPDGGLQPSMSTIPFTVTGLYRFAGVPALQRGYTPVRLVLKRDSSGGAGQVTGDTGLDETVAETSLWFQPDPGQARGEIQFQHVFQISPGSLDAVPGTTSRYYALFTIDDSLAPTSQLSTGVDYTHILPIHIVDRNVVRPELTGDGARPLRWQIQLNGQTWMEIPSDGPELDLEQVLAQGGIGDYAITLETQAEGKWVTASNAVSVELAPPTTETPSSTETPVITPETVGTPGATTPTPAGPPPPTPTRRPRPQVLTPEETSAISPTPTGGARVTATATRTLAEQNFWADSRAILSGECTMLHWNVQNITAIFLDGEPVTGVESRRVCPTQSKTYVLRSVGPSGNQERRLTISVGSQSVGALDFSADAYQIAKGACTTLRWRAQGVRAVYLNDIGVEGDAAKEVCPQATSLYTLRVVGSDGTSTSRGLTISVAPGSGILKRFWADQYTMSSGECTILYWFVQEVQAVYVGITGSETGVPGVGNLEVCPVGRASYTLRATASDGRSDSTELVLNGEEPSLGADEVIVQGAVRDVVRMGDISSGTPGEQPGWQLIVEGVDLLFSGPTNCCQDPLKVELPQALVEQQSVFGVPIDWPINWGQLVEFRAVCSDDTCSLDSGPPMYLRLRSQ